MIKDLEQAEKEERTKFSDILDARAFLAEVKTKIKSEVTSDYVLGRFVDKDKQAIRDLGSDAFFIYNIFEVMSREKEVLPVQKKLIMQNGQDTFTEIFTQLHLTAVLSRNVNKNFVLRAVAGLDPDGEQPPPNAEDTVTNKLKQLLKPEEREKEK